MRFEWDEAKRAANMAKHGLDLAKAQDVFDGRPNVLLTSARVGEARLLTIAIFEGKFVTVIWTERDDVVRLISMRRSRDAERGQYRERHG
jgi:uncharacterized DUF497 family protein